jgi:hypothetical protein
MKLHLGKLIVCIVILSVLLFPSAVQGMTIPLPYESSITTSFDISARDTNITTSPSAVSHTVTVYAVEASYVYDQMSTTNFNASPYGNHLVVGTGQEFGGQEWTFIEFGPAMESRGGPIPEGSTITGVQLKLYKESGDQGAVNVYQPMADFSESSLTWDNKPGSYSPVRGSATLPTSNGWCTINMNNTTIVTDPENHGRNANVVIKPAWTALGKEMSFHSDENPSNKPRLVITYTGAAPEEQEPPPTPPPANDTTPCIVTYSVTPHNPRVGEMVTVTARATDDQAMYYLTISRGMSELARADATSGQRELTVSYTEEAVLPSLNYIIIGDDLGDAPAQGGNITVPVTGSGTPPEVTIEAEWETETIPDRYRLVAGDGQRVVLTATATDPDGIRMLTISINGRAYDWSFDGDTSVTRTLEWINDNPSLTFFAYHASAVDRESTYTSTDSVSTDIAQPHDILMYTTGAPGFHNPSRDRLPWERMVQTFGVGECYTVYKWDWKSWYALIWYHAGFKEIAKKGECFGMSTMATEIYKSRIIAHDIDSSASCAAYMSYDNTFTKEYVEARQGGQMGEEVLFTRCHERYVSTSEKLDRIEATLTSNTPGVLSIHEGDHGHAIVPWMVRHMDDGTTRVYVYDCNREDAIIPLIEERDSGHPSYDFSNYDLFPYVEIRGSNWSYTWPDGGIWNDELAYFTYEEACGDMDQDNPLGESSFAPRITDHDIPSVLQFLFCPIGGDADAYIEDEDGNITGIYNGEIREEIPDSMAIRPMTGPFSEQELYLLPVDKKLKINLVGTGDGEYTMGLLGDGTLFGMEGKRIRVGATDRIIVDPTVLGVLAYAFRVVPETEDDSFNLALVFMFEGLVAATGSDHIERETVMEDVSCGEESDFSCYVEEGGDSFVVESYGEDIGFDLSMRSSESADAVDSLDDIDYIPGSVEEDITLGGGERLEAYPEDWSTTEKRGNLHTLSKRTKSGSKGTGFPVIPVVIGVCVVAVAAVVITILLKKGVFSKAGK